MKVYFFKNLFLSYFFYHVHTAAGAGNTTKVLQVKVVWVCSSAEGSTSGLPQRVECRRVIPPHKSAG